MSVVRPIALLAALLATLWLGGCRGRSATAEDCAAILDRIVELELRERGFKDPVLLARRQAELRERYAADLRRCLGRPIPEGALDCLRRADSTEKLSHECLR